jgi:hypothetical protein
MAVDCSLTTMMDVAIIAACGLSFFFFSVAVAAVTMVDVSNIGNIQNGDGFIRRLF